MHCTQCGTQTTKPAGFCTNCGAKLSPSSKKRTPLWVFVGIPIIVVAAIVSIAAVTQSETERKSDEMTPEQKAAAKKEQDEAAARYLAIKAAKTVLVQNLRDPESLKIDSLRMSNDATLICIQYRAKNGFGGMNREFLVIQNGKASQKTTSWNKFCVQELMDVTDLQ